MNWEYKINKETFRITKTEDGYYIVGIMDDSETDSGFFRFNQGKSATLDQARAVLLDQIESYSYVNWT